MGTRREHISKYRREKVIFSVCFSVHRGRGYPSLWSQVLSRGTPSPVTAIVQSPVPGPTEGGTGYPSQDRTGQEVPSSPRQDRGTLPDRTASDAMPRAVCLLRLCRRTFLFNFLFFLKKLAKYVLVPTENLVHSFFFQDWA